MTDPCLIRQKSTPLPLLPPPELPPDLEVLCSPELPPLKGIHSVIFDVYGTLFISAAGDIGSGDNEPHYSLDSLAREYGLSAEQLRGYFQKAVLKRHGELRGRSPYPELRVEELWAEFLEQHGHGNTMDKARELALRYELTVNPVYPMPDAEKTLGILRERLIPLGLISNAQFFTPLLFEAFFNAPPKNLGFDPELLIYSFELGEAKPSPNLFSPAVRRLKSLGLEPENALYVGNDMLNDISPAAQAGFKTVLFAGDRRSLRLREGESRVKGVRPDRIIRNLKDLPALFVPHGLY
ncbi:HAD family hydrolase [Treponema primitia]|uniref:HAD family hydrolase n=1 Tax=Treponema primitia TaxID=88058 RepID=UPI0039812EB2